MVILNTIRSALYTRQGARARPHALQQYKAYRAKNTESIPVDSSACTSSSLSSTISSAFAHTLFPSAVIPLTSEVRNKIYMGLGTGSHIPYYHVNHARMVEAMGFGRSYFFGLMMTTNNSRNHCQQHHEEEGNWRPSPQRSPFLESINVQYTSEMPLMKSIISRVQCVGDLGSLNSSPKYMYRLATVSSTESEKKRERSGKEEEAVVGASSFPPSSPRASSSSQSLNFLHQLESLDGRTIYAIGLAKVRWEGIQSAGVNQSTPINSSSFSSNHGSVMTDQATGKPSHRTSFIFTAPGIDRKLIDSGVDNKPLIETMKGSNLLLIDEADYCWRSSITEAQQFAKTTS